MHLYNVCVNLLLFSDELVWSVIMTIIVIKIITVLSKGLFSILTGNEDGRLNSAPLSTPLAGFRHPACYAPINSKLQHPTPGHTPGI